MLTRDEVQHIAKLARLGLSEKEIGRYQKELSSILDYIEKLKGFDVFVVEPTSHSLKIENIMRKDGPSEKGGEERAKKLLKLAPETKNNYLKVKQIF